jgi:hypothetical protein
MQRTHKCKNRVLRSGRFCYNSDSNSAFLCGLSRYNVGKRFMLGWPVFDLPIFSIRFYCKLPHISKVMHFSGTLLPRNWQVVVIWGWVLAVRGKNGSWIVTKLNVYQAILKLYLWMYDVWSMLGIRVFLARSGSLKVLWQSVVHTCSPPFKLDLEL